jgi:hypothetical protein
MQRVVYYWEGYFWHKFCLVIVNKVNVQFAALAFGKTVFKSNKAKGYIACMHSVKCNYLALLSVLKRIID